MTEGFKELLKLAKASRISTIDELEDLVSECQNEITGADFDCVRQKLKIKGEFTHDWFFNKKGRQDKIANGFEIWFEVQNIQR